MSVISDSVCTFSAAPICSDFFFPIKTIPYVCMLYFPQSGGGHSIPFVVSLACHALSLVVSCIWWYASLCFLLVFLFLRPSDCESKSLLVHFVMWRSFEFHHCWSSTHCGVLIVCKSLVCGFDGSLCQGCITPTQDLENSQCRKSDPSSCSLWGVWFCFCYGSHCLPQPHTPSSSKCKHSPLGMH